MTNYYLVGVSHSDDYHDLMCPESMTRFTAEVSPIITNNSLILCEGFVSDGLIRPSHVSYSHMKRRVFGDLLGSKQPTFAGLDFRMAKPATQVQASTERHRRWCALIDELIQSPNIRIPSSSAEMVTALRRNQLPVAQLARTPTSEEVEVARGVAAESRKFDRVYLEAMQKHGRKFDNCFFVGGGVHAINMSLKNDYQLMDLTRRIAIFDTYWGILSDYHWTKLFLSSRP